MGLLLGYVYGSPLTSFMICYYFEGRSGGLYMDVMENVIPRYFVFDNGLTSLTDAVLTWVYSLGWWDCGWIVSEASTWLFLPQSS